MPTPEQSHSQTSEQLKAVKAMCEKAPSGPKKTQANVHLTAAEAAYKQKENGQCIAELEKVRAALK
ncbi:hypothetical protein [Aestuariispira insulae]|uniref:Uncharacterized protein n=1 Tax=Aestuariispira insulae TaxID=1461337 RepID=A0A3D9H0P0_9PROT|nr:hypothetical protein [Aestuariispira insulae]RED43074.1 hypothetical protein DFP90_1404 [Aestuariispira insulae]